VNVDVTVNGRPWKVRVEAGESAGQFTLVLKGRSRVVDAAWIDAESLSLVDAGPGSAVHEIGIQRRGPGELDVVVAGRRFQAVVVQGSSSARPVPSGRQPQPSAGKGAQSILAPMPGRIVRVLVAPGDEVTAGQGVVIMEAMKMENELRSTRDGIVREVAAREGTAVETGAVLVVVDS
jgi:biotin carboxyl carrier protein